MSFFGRAFEALSGNGGSVDSSKKGGSKSKKGATAKGRTSSKAAPAKKSASMR